MLPNRLKKVRKEKGLSQFEVARRTGLHPSLLSHIENCKILPFPGWKRRIAEALGVAIEEIFPEG